jgi:hypothetical protein
LAQPLPSSGQALGVQNTKSPRFSASGVDSTDGSPVR